MSYIDFEEVVQMGSEAASKGAALEDLQEAVEQYVRQYEAMNGRNAMMPPEEMRRAVSAIDFGNLQRSLGMPTYPPDNPYAHAYNGELSMFAEKIKTVASDGLRAGRVWTKETQISYLETVLKEILSLCGEVVS